MMTLTEARDKLRTKCAAASDPALTDAELDQCLGEHQRPADTTYSELYDMGGATRAAWLMKAAKAAERIGMADRSLRINDDALQAHCLKQADRYAAAWVA